MPATAVAHPARNGPTRRHVISGKGSRRVEWALPSVASTELGRVAAGAAGECSATPREAVTRIAAHVNRMARRRPMLKSPADGGWRGHTLSQAATHAERKP